MLSGDCQVPVMESSEGFDRSACPDITVSADVSVQLRWHRSPTTIPSSEISLEGIVVGDLCHLNWTLTSAETVISGQADLSKPSEDSITGTWQSPDSIEPGGKLNGKRD